MNLVEFAEGYARQGGTTVQWLREQGREARECTCGEESCPGFQMAHVENEPEECGACDGVGRVCPYCGSSQIDLDIGFHCGEAIGGGDACGVCMGLGEVMGG